MGIALAAVAGFVVLLLALSNKARAQSPALPAPTSDTITPATPGQPSAAAVADATTIAQAAGAGAAQDTQAMANQAAALNREVAAGRMSTDQARAEIVTTGQTLNAHRQAATQRMQAAALTAETQHVQAQVAAGTMTPADGKVTIQSYVNALHGAAQGIPPAPHPATVAAARTGKPVPPPTPGTPTRAPVLHMVPTGSAAPRLPAPAQRVPSSTATADDHLATHEAIDRDTRAARAPVPRTLPQIPSPGALPPPPPAMPLPPPPPPPATPDEMEFAPNVDAPVTAAQRAYRRTHEHLPHEAAPPAHRAAAHPAHAIPLPTATITPGGSSAPLPEIAETELPPDTQGHFVTRG